MHAVGRARQPCGSDIQTTHKRDPYGSVLGERLLPADWRVRPENRADGPAR